MRYAMFAVAVFVVAVFAGSLAFAQSQPSASCPVTDASAAPFVPPASFLFQSDPSRFFFGTEKLWIDLPLSGIYPTVKDGDGYFTKQAWWSSNYNPRTLDDWRASPKPQLTITVRRLDSADKSAVMPPQKGSASFIENTGAFFMSGPTFPSLGCWEVTGQLEDAQLTFVLWVVN